MSETWQQLSEGDIEPGFYYWMRHIQNKATPVVVSFFVYSDELYLYNNGQCILAKQVNFPNLEFIKLEFPK